MPGKVKSLQLGVESHLNSRLQTLNSRLECKNVFCACLTESDPFQESNQPLAAAFINHLAIPALPRLLHQPGQSAGQRAARARLYSGPPRSPARGSWG